MSYRKSVTFIFMVKLLCTPIVASVNDNLQENIALNKHATQSGNLTYPGTGDVWSASNAVDGNKDCRNADKDHFSGTAYEQVPWWQVDLGNIYSLSTINVYGRHEEFPVQLKGFQVYLLTSENSKEKQHIYNNTNYVNGGVFTITVQQNVFGRYVRIEMPGTYRQGLSGPLLICEVEVYPRVNLIRQLTHVVTNQTGVYETFDSSKAIDGKERFDVDACNCCSVTNGAIPSWWQIDLGNKYLIDTVMIYGRADIGVNNDQLEHATVYASNYTMVNRNTTQKLIFEIPTITTTTVFTHHMSTATIAQVFTVKGLRKILTICEFKLFRKVCDVGKFGEGCSHTCYCSDNNSCDAITGKCQRPGCFPSWRGELCNLKCESRSFGENCSHTCHCINQTNCDNVNGHCEEQECDPGWKGASCDTKCESRSFGKHCSHTCHCINQTNCDNVNGHCEKLECNPGWKGASCDTKCDCRSFGKNCSHTSHCINQTSCDNVNGHCEKQECDPGWKGASCDIICESRSFGQNCSHTCHCINQSDCDNVNGHCEKLECDPGWKGSSCDTHNNILYRLRNEIKTSMSTVAGNWTSDRAVDGNTGPDPNKCQCCSGTTNEPLSWWMVDFGERVPVNGIAIYSRNNENDNRQLQGFQVILSGDTSYNASAFMSKSLGMFSKMYVIKLKDILTRFIKIQRPGILTLCEVKVFQGVCEQGKFGHECSRECHCGDNKPCNQLTGSCQSSACKPGWQGPSCNETCPPETFGDNCSDSCYCAEGTCTNNYGICLGRCRQGYNGAHCNQVGSEVKSDTAVLLGVVGGGGAFLVGAVIIGIVVLKLRRRNRESVKSEYETPNRRASQTEIQEYDTIGNVTDSPAYENETATGL